MKTWERGFWCGLVLLALCAAVLSIAKPQLARPETWQAVWYGPAVEEAAAARDSGPAPHLRKGPTYKAKGHKVMSWIASSAGIANANGIYTGVGSPFVNEHGYNLVDIGDYWIINSGGGDPLYVSDGASLPGNPWTTTPDGTAPAPTLAAGGTPPDWPWNWWWDGPYYGPGDHIRPCRATIGGTNYILFPFQGLISAVETYLIAFAEIITADPLDIAFTRKTWTTTPVFYGATTHDPGQTAAAYDAGDGTHIYICSGSYLDGSDDPYFDFAAWDVTPATPTKGTVDTVALPTVHITPFLQVAADTFRFMCVDGADAKYYEYVVGSGTITLLGTDALPALPGGYSDVACSADAIGRLDISLYERDGTVLFGRHVVSGTTHRIVENSVVVT